MSFILSLIIILAADYFALFLFWQRHKKELINRPSYDFSDDLSVINFRKNKKKTASKVKKVKDPDDEIVEDQDSDDLIESEE